MAKHKISINAFSSKSIQNAIKELEKYKSSIEYKTKLLAERLAQEGVEIARVKVSDFDAILSGELIGSIHDEYISSIPHGAIYAVKCDSNHAAYVEFGTGQKGADNPAQHLPDGVDWEYNIGQTIKQKPDGTHYWFYPGKDGKWHYTEGMPSRPFMYETTMELYSKVEQIAKEVFK